jgi:ribulose-5-phosphate 4-epimerase/fuculose-1-phosphate aldolase
MDLGMGLETETETETETEMEKDPGNLEAVGVSAEPGAVKNGSSGAAQGLSDLVAAASQAQREGLVISTSGNFSRRVGDRSFAITPARVRLGDLRREDLLVLPVEGADDERAAESGPPSPSRETPMHRGLYSAHPRIGSVLHFQSFAGTALGCGKGALPGLDFIPEVPVYLRKIAEVPYLPPGSAELAARVVEAFGDPDVRLVQLRNHGQVVIGDTPAQAVERALFFELAARIALVCGEPLPLRRFTPGELQRLWSY